jgi:diacylglycerol kinase family enzyme
MTSLIAGDHVPVPQRVGVATAVVVNPSKVDDLDAHREEIRAALATAGWPEPLWLPTTAEDPGCGMAQQALDSGAEVVFACGGDGTVMACAAVLAGTQVALAVLPAGTGNLLANNLDLPSDIAAGVMLATDGHRRRIDVGAVEDADTVSGHAGTFTIMAGMGFDAQMLDSTPEGLKKRIGWLAYVIAALRHLRHRPIPVRIRLDQADPIRRRVRTVLVANVGRLHGGIPLLPDALADDGWLDIAVLTPRTLRHWAWLAAGVIGRRRDIPRMETFRARRIEVLSDRVQPRELDGDVIAPGRSLIVTVRPNALLMCAPPVPAAYRQHSGAGPGEEYAGQVAHG